MTNEEAIKILKTELEVRSNGYYDHLQSGGKGDCEEEASLTALQLAIESLEQQIPKKPILNKNKINPHWVEEALLCPTCNRYVGSSGDKFCGYCGQAIDWGDAE